MNIGRETTASAKEIDRPDVTVGSFTSIAPGVIFYGHIHYPVVNHPSLVCNKGFLWEKWTGEFNISKGPIKVGNDVWIGFDAVILSGVTIGNGAIIGMKTVVTKDVPPYAVAVGSPMKIIKYRFSPKVIEQLEKIKWWDWPDEVIRSRHNDFLDIDTFLEKYGKQ